MYSARRTTPSKTRVLPIEVARNGYEPKPCFAFIATLVLSLFCFVLAFSSSSAAQAKNTIQTVAGGAYPCDLIPAGAATLADIPGPTSMAMDASGNSFIAAANSYCVFKVDTSGIISVFAGNGIQGYSGDAGPATKANLYLPMAVKVDSAGNVYIADQSAIRIVTTDGNINTFAGNGKLCYTPTSPCGDGGPATQAQLNTPQALAVDAAGNLYIADSNINRIRKVSGGVITTVAGDGNQCAGGTSVCGDGGPATQSQLNWPAGIAVDASGNLYVSDTDDQRVRLVSAGTITAYAGTGQVCPDPTYNCGDTGIATSGKMHWPSGLALDAAGNLYVADNGDHRIREVTSIQNNTRYITTVAGSGVEGFTGDGGSAATAELNSPTDVFADAAGDLWISDTGNQRVRSVVAGNINTVAGGGMGGDGQAPPNATLANPIGVVWDASGTNYYIADTANNRIRKVATGSNPSITTVAGNGNAGWTGDGGPALSATLNAPNHLALDASGDIYIADTNNLVVRRVDASGNISTLAGNGVSCLPLNAVCGDGGPATQASLVQPTSLAVDAKGDVYIADHWGNRVRCVMGSAGGCLGSKLPVGDITTVAGTGLQGFRGDGGLGSKARMHHPRSVAVDASGNVYIADAGNSRIRCLVAVKGGCGGSTYPVGTIITYALSGKPYFCGEGGPALQACMFNPAEVSVDPAGNVYVAAGPDSVVRRIDAVTQTIWTVAGNPGKPQKTGFGGDGAASRQATLNNWSASANASGYLLIADSGNNRIRQVNMLAVVKKLTTQISFGNQPVGQTSAPQAASLQDTGLASLAISSVILTGKNAGDFAISSNSCVTQLAPDAICSTNVTFTPLAKGTRTATLTFSDSVGNQTVSLTGVGQ